MCPFSRFLKSSTFQPLSPYIQKANTNLGATEEFIKFWLGCRQVSPPKALTPAGRDIGWEVGCDSRRTYIKSKISAFNPIIKYWNIFN